MMSRYWVVVGGNNPRIFKQVGVVERRGRRSPPFPAYVECRNFADAEVIFALHEIIQPLFDAYEDREALALEVAAIPGLAGILEDVSPFWVILNGRSFKGILLSETDLRAQTVGYEWASFRRAYTLKEALLLLIRGGDRVGDNEVGSISAGFSRLSLSSASHTSHTLSSRRSVTEGPPRLPEFTVNLTASVHNSVTVGSNMSATLDTTEHGLGSSRLTPKKPLAPTRYSTPATIASASAPRVYKYTRSAAGIVGTITDPSGTTSNITTRILNTVGSSRAAYLDAHGFGSIEIERISYAYGMATDVHDFVSHAAGSGMTVAELEWFWVFP